MKFSSLGRYYAFMCKDLKSFVKLQFSMHTLIHMRSDLHTSLTYLNCFGDNYFAMRSNLPRQTSWASTRTNENWDINQRDEIISEYKCMMMILTDILRSHRQRTLCDQKWCQMLTIIKTVIMINIAMHKIHSALPDVCA